MKRLIWTVVLFSILTTSIALGKEKKPEEKPTPEATAESKPKPVELRVDLALPETTVSLPLPVSDVGYKVKIINKLVNPDFQYAVQVKVENISAAPLTFPSATPPSAAKTPQGSTPSAASLVPADPCSILGEALAKLREINDEKKLPSAINEVNEDLKKVDTGCDHRWLATEAVSQTAGDAPNYPILGTGIKITVSITRLDANKKPLKKWQYTFSPPKNKNWDVTYGFGFIPRPSVFCADTQYFAQSSGTSFIITPLTTNWRFDTAPAVFFSRDLFDDTSLGIQAGLGFDLTAPVVYFGPCLKIFDNVILGGGVALHQEQRLKGQYSAGQTISTTLSPDQLHDNVYVPDLFFNISLNFATNPFPSAPKAGTPATGGQASGGK